MSVRAIVLCVFPHGVDKEAKAQEGEKKTNTSKKMSVTTVGDVVNIKNQGWRWRFGGGEDWMCG